jgi:hypothetical protein
MWEGGFHGGRYEVLPDVSVRLHCQSVLTLCALQQLQPGALLHHFHCHHQGYPISISVIHWAARLSNDSKRLSVAIYTILGYQFWLSPRGSTSQLLWLAEYYIPYSNNYVIAGRKIDIEFCSTNFNLPESFAKRLFHHLVQRIWLLSFWFARSFLARSFRSYSWSTGFNKKPIYDWLCPSAFPIGPFGLTLSPAYGHLLWVLWTGSFPWNCVFIAARMSWQRKIHVSDWHWIFIQYNC